MKIGLVARWLSLESGGAKEYTKHLIQHLLEIDHGSEYVVFYNSHKFVGRFPAAKEVVIPISNKLLWDYIGLPIHVWKEHIDLLWIPSYVIPFPITCPSVVTFLDMAYFLMPEAYKRGDVLYMQHAIPGSVKRASALLAISENTKHDIARLFPGLESKIVVTHLAPSPDYKRVTDEKFLASVRAKHNIRRPFVFYAGSISPRKGLSLLLKAFIKLKKERRISHCLVITGGRTWGNPEINRLLEQLPQQQVLILGHVPGSVLPAIYSLAGLFVYPSLFEGFGLPVLEAMACGCPVVCSNLTSLPEVAGDAALLIDPRDTSSLANAMYTALTDPHVRTGLIEKGLVRAASFTWEKTAQKTLEVFEQVARQNRGP